MKVGNKWGSSEAQLDDRIYYEIDYCGFNTNQQLY